MSDKSEEDSGVEQDNFDIWVTEYEQAGEEGRYRDRMIHNTYYLTVIVGAAFLSQIFRLWSGSEYLRLSVLMSIGGAVALFLGGVILAHESKRHSAWSLRTDIETRFHREEINTLRIQKRVLGQSSKFNLETGELEEADRWIDRVKSARLIGKIMLVGGIVVWISFGMISLFKLFA
ncbi:hypothetical protein [Haloarcula marismortui]|nr:hypothetical protein [Haloarcula marismortui]QCP91815.1 hypothetical protein E6P14_13465 [Haloarcula marismortui ATCC 43049]